jgi:hypothetical protein
MTKSTTNGTIELIKVLNNSVLTLGVRKVIGYLKWITNMNGNDPKDIADLVIYSVCEKYKIKPSELLESDRNDGDRNDAICLMAILLKKHALMSQNDIAFRLNRHKSQISKYVSRMSHLNTELFKQDRRIYANYIEINESIELIIKNEETQWMKRENEEDLENPLQ